MVSFRSGRDSQMIFYSRGGARVFAWGGGDASLLLRQHWNAAPALKSLSGGGGGGGDSDTFFSDFKFFQWGRGNRWADKQKKKIYIYIYIYTSLGAQRGPLSLFYVWSYTMKIYFCCCFSVRLQPIAHHQKCFTPTTVRSNPMNGIPLLSTINCWSNYSIGPNAQSANLTCNNGNFDAPPTCHGMRNDSFDFVNLETCLKDDTSTTCHFTFIRKSFLFISLYLCIHIY